MVRPCLATKGPGLVPTGPRGTVRGFIRNDRLPAAFGGQFGAAGRVGVWGGARPGLGELGHTFRERPGCPWEQQRRARVGRDASQAGLVWGSPGTESQEGQKELALRDPAKGRKKERGLGPSHLQEEGAQRVSCG